MQNNIFSHSIGNVLGIKSNLQMDLEYMRGCMWDVCKNYSILQKGLEHLWIWVSSGGLRINPLSFEGTTVFLLRSIYFKLCLKIT